MSPAGRDFILALAKHLPPSGTRLKLLDIGGAAGAVLATVRGDLAPLSVSVAGQDWDIAPESMDAAVAVDVPLDNVLLGAALAALRPGGRLIVVHAGGAPDETIVHVLEDAGYIRILVETALENGAGVLMRGEKPHTTDDTLARIREVTGRDALELDFETYKGRYVHLLVRQTPNKPPWRLQPGEVVTWEAMALDVDGQAALLAFNSLPGAVSFMQQAVLANKLKDVHKVVKFSRETARTWDTPALLNPLIETLDLYPVVLLPIDPQTAETPDE